MRPAEWKWKRKFVFGGDEGRPQITQIDADSLSSSSICVVCGQKAALQTLRPLSPPELHRSMLRNESGQRLRRLRSVACGEDRDVLGRSHLCLLRTLEPDAVRVGHSPATIQRQTRRTRRHLAQELSG